MILRIVPKFRKMKEPEPTRAWGYLEQGTIDEHHRGENMIIDTHLHVWSDDFERYPFAEGGKEPKERRPSC